MIFIGADLAAEKEQKENGAKVENQPLKEDSEKLTGDTIFQTISAEDPQEEGGLGFFLL
jgi:hypothetical protein